MRNSTSYLHFIIGALFVGFVATNSFGQTGPAGVGSSTTNKVWLDAHSLGFPDGSPVGVWPDLSGSGTNFTQGASLRQPIFNISGPGGLPTLTFDGINDVLACGAVPGLESANITYFMVYDRTSTTSDMLINAKYASHATKWRTYMNSGQTTILSAQYSPSINWVRYNDPVGSSFFSSHITPTTIRTYNQGTLAMSKTATYTTPTGHQNLTIGNKTLAGTGTYIYTGQISEVIVFNTALNPLQRIMVENYLGAKYGMSIPIDRYAFEATHKFGLIGIGNDGTDSQTSARGAGVLTLSDATSLGTGDYMLVANTDVSLSEYDLIDVPVALPAHQRFERTWRVDETGDVGNITLSFTLGGADFAVPESYRLLVDSDGTFSDATIVTGTYDAGTISFTLDLADGAYFTLSGIQEILYIHSITDGLWSEPSTWDCDCIPNSDDFVFIDPLTTVTVDVDAFTDYLNVGFLATLVMDTDVTLDLNGDFDIIGDIDFTAGTLSLTGDEAQLVDILSTSDVTIHFYNLLINNTSAGNVTFANRKFALDGLMSPIRGNIVIDPTTQFIISSTSPTEGGRVGPIIPPTNFTGEFVVQRNIPAGVADWRNLSSPVVGSTFDDWDPDLAMSGPGFPDGCAFGPDSCFRSVTFMDHGIFNEVLNSSDPITNTRGYEIFVGSDLVTFSGTTLNSVGSLNTSSDIVQTLNTGWTTIGNPYACPIAFSTLSRDASIGNYFYVYDPASGAYEWYDGASGTSSLPEITEDGLMATGQAVWVFASSIGNITYTQFNKVENGGTYIRAAIEDKNLILTLNEQSSTYAGTARLEEFDGAVDGTDESFDIRHLSTGLERAPSIAIASGDDILRKNYIKNDGRDKSFELYTNFINEGYYTISADNWANFRTYHKILLFDNETGETVNLKDAPYSFFANATDSEEPNNERFTLLLINSREASDYIVTFSTDDDELNAVVIKQFGNVIDVQTDQEAESQSTVTVTNVLGQINVFSVTTNLVSGSNLITLPANLKGFYIISVRTGDQLVTKKIVL